MLDFIENWLKENLTSSDSLISYRLNKTAGATNSIRVELVSVFGEGEIYAWEDGRFDVLLFKFGGDETISTRFALTKNYQRSTAILLARIVDQLSQE